MTDIEKESIISLTDRCMKELWHKFFLRLHVHVRGTIKKSDGEYIGLIENDIVPILQGSQGQGKTTLCRWLAVEDDLYIDLGSGGRGSGFGTEDTVRKVRGKLIAELGEMKILKTEADIEPVKSFISSKSYEYNAKYIEYTSPLPSTVSYIGTSNPEEYLIDDTENRRFYPINLESIDKDALLNQPELAEKIHAHYSRLAANLNGHLFKHLEISPELRDFMNDKRESATVVYSDYTAILEVIPTWYKQQTVIDKTRLCLQIHNIEKIVGEAFPLVRITRKGARKAMTSLGWVHTDRRLTSGEKRRGWFKLTNAAGVDLSHLSPLAEDGQEIF